MVPSLKLEKKCHLRQEKRTWSKISYIVFSQISTSANAGIMHTCASVGTWSCIHMHVYSAHHTCTHVYMYTYKHGHAHTHLTEKKKENQRRRERRMLSSTGLILDWRPVIFKEQKAGIMVVSASKGIFFPVQQGIWR